MRHPVVTSLVLLFITAFSGSALPTLSQEFGYRVLLGGDHPAIQRLEGVMDRYGGGFPAYIVWRCGDGSPCESVFDESSLARAAAIEAQLLAVDGVSDVLSPYSMTLMVPSDDGFAALRASDLVRGSAEFEDFVRHARADPVWQRHILSADGRTGAVVALLADARNETAERVTEAVLAAVSPEELAQGRFHLAGEGIESVVAGRDLASSTASITPLIAIIIATVVFVLTRSWKATLVTMSAMGIALVWTFGFHAWLGWPQDSILEVLAPLIMTIGTCDAVHLVTQAASRLAEDPSPEEVQSAIENAAREVGPACVVTTATTASAIGSFATSGLDTFVRFGLTAAFGTVACLFLTFTLIPIMARRISLSGSHEVSRSWGLVLDSIAETTRRRPGRIVAVTLALVGINAIGLTLFLRVGTDVSEMYGEQNRVTRWTRFVEHNLRGLESLELDLSLPTPDAILEPASQEALAKLAGLLEAEPALGRVTSVQTLLGNLNRILHSGDPGFDRPADSMAGNAELFELIGFGAPHLLDSWISPDRQHVRISAEAASDSASEESGIVERMAALLHQALPPGWDLTLTGSFALDFEWVNEVQSTQLRSFGVAFLLVIVLVSFFLRSVLLGAIAMVPALVPVVLVLGFLGWTDLPLDVGRLMIAAIVIGIGVDDSIHFLTSYRGHLERGEAHEAALNSALSTVGRALIVTSVSLALGFVALTLSAWQTISSFGFFVFMAVLVALLSALFVLPALMCLLGEQPGFRRDRPAAASADAE